MPCLFNKQVTLLFLLLQLCFSAFRGLCSFTLGHVVKCISFDTSCSDKLQRKEQWKHAPLYASLYLFICRDKKREKRKNNSLWAYVLGFYFLFDLIQKPSMPAWQSETCVHASVRLASTKQWPFWWPSCKRHRDRVQIIPIISEIYIM